MPILRFPSARRLGALGLLLLLSLAVSARAQEGDAAPAQDQPAQDQPAQDQPAPAGGDAPAGDSAASFAKLMGEWRAIIKQLRTLKDEYRAADEARAEGIRKEWSETLAKGEALLPKLREAGLQAYLAAPGKDPELSRFLAQMAADDVEGDRYEEAAAVALPIADQGSEDGTVLAAAGIAAFATNDYERAEKYLAQAQAAAIPSPSLADKVGQYASLVPKYKEYWERERALREQEAQQNLPRVLLKTTQGDIEIELFENEAPGAVGNFISLVEKKFYDGLTFHRVLSGFMAQGGCPDGTGAGGPGYQIKCECEKPEHRIHFRGSLSMAHAGKDTGGSQFFLTFVPTDHLNGRHTVFGRVVQGMDVLAKLRRRDPEADLDVTPDKILSATVLRKDPNKTYEPDKAE